jgi:surfeit locus 1 family protein
MKRSFAFFTLFLIAVFLGLGTWQMFRKTEKEALLLTLADSKKKPFSPLTSNQLAEFEPLYVEGRFLQGKSIFLQSKTFQGKSGVYVLNPFKTSEGKIILIQRGWASIEITDAPEAMLKIEGFVRYPTSPTYFQPSNTKDNHFWIDLNSLSQELNVPLQPFYIVSKNSFHPDIKVTDPIPPPRNNHLSYAITWYLLAFLLTIMFFYNRNKSNKGNDYDSSDNNSA